MTGRLSEKSRPVDHSSALWIFGSESQCVDPGKRDCGRTHRAGLEADPERAAIKAGLPKSGSRMTDRNHFRMCGGIQTSAHRISGFRDDVITHCDHRTHGNLARFGRDRSKVECAPHRIRQWEGHGRFRATARRRVCHVFKAR